MNSLKYFNEKASDYHIASAGSLIGIRLSGPKSFPVGKVDFLSMYPLSFIEFLDASGNGEIRELIHDTKFAEPFPLPFHDKLVGLLKLYYFIGGMPEAVSQYVSSGNLDKVRKIQNAIISSYELDFAKHATPNDVPKLSIIWNSIPVHLGKENKKFVFSALKKSARAREYENALQWLEDAGLIIRVKLTHSIKLPLKAYADSDAFKIYCLDVGLLSAMSNLHLGVITTGDRLFTEYKGALVENYVAQQLLPTNSSLYYWKSNGIAEVDFILEYGNKILPFETKAGINPRSKSMKVYMERNQPDRFYRVTLLNLKYDGKVANIPLYAISLFPGI